MPPRRQSERLHFEFTNKSGEDSFLTLTTQNYEIIEIVEFFLFKNERVETTVAFSKNFEDHEINVCLFDCRISSS